jgi:hypothetical protein
MPDDLHDIASSPASATLSQCAADVLMIRPAAFAWNPETADSNRFQLQGSVEAGLGIRRAIEEFDACAESLRRAGVRVHAFDDRPEPPCPDSVFPNNWVSFHHDGTVVLYPMLAASRRRERRMDLLGELELRGGFQVTRLVDLSHHELAGRYLEGTGSVVFDHRDRNAYACLSPRTDPAVLHELCDELAYEPVLFAATDAGGMAVYHTNVLLALGERLAFVCAEAIARGDRDRVLEELRRDGRRTIVISRTQMGQFAGNALELRSADGSGVLAISERAHASLDDEAREVIAGSVARVVRAAVPTIEDVGGGSVRCMLAEVFLPRRGVGPAAETRA